MTETDAGNQEQPKRLHAADESAGAAPDAPRPRTAGQPRDTARQWVSGLGGFRGLVRNWLARSVALTAVSAVISVLTSCVNLALGVIGASEWVAINAGYCLFLALVRGYLSHRVVVLQTDERAKGSLDVARAYRIRRRGGLLLTLGGVGYLLICRRMTEIGEPPHYPGWVALGIATMAFVQMGTAIAGVWRTRGLRTPVFGALRRFALADAMVAMVLTQCALLTRQGSPNAVISSALFGMGVGALIALIGLLTTLTTPAARTTTTETDDGGTTHE